MDSTGRFRSTHRWATPSLIFLLALLPRAVTPISRPMQWYDRAVRFSDALLAADWPSTFQRYHPGVMTMWLSGIGLKFFAAARGLTSGQLLGSEPTQPGVIAEAVWAGVVPLALVIACCIALSYVLLGRLGDRRVALVGAWLLALDPFYITYSQVLHVDALLATFMLVSALFLLNYLKRGKGSDLVLSGVFGGLALLSKNPALFLVPYVGLVVGGHGLVAGRGEVIQRVSESASQRESDSARERISGGVGWLWGIVRVLGVWVLVAAAVFVALWPAMWVQPLDVLGRMLQRIVFHVGTEHYNPVFFNGRAGLMDPGPLFYVATIGWKTTLVTLPMMGLGAVLAVLRLWRGRQSVAMWFVAYAVFFTAQMCTGARKELAYLLPVFPALDVVAAVGVVWMAERVGQVRVCQGRRWVEPAVMVGVLMVQAVLVLPRHPYYGTLHNRLLGGSRVAQRVLPLQDQGEGLDLAARVLNTLPHAQRASAGLHQRGASIFRRNLIGLATAIDAPQVDYRVYFVNQVMRQLDVETWGPMWQADQQTEPLWTVEFDGVTYVWVYGAPPEDLAPGGPEIELDYRLGEHIRLKRVRLSADTLVPGDRLTVVLMWTSDGEVEQSYRVFCHIMSESGELVAQQDGVPLRGVRPTPTWRAGEVLEDSYDIVFGDHLPPGEYRLSVGMYDPESLERLAAYGASGFRLPEDRIPVVPLRVEVPETTGE